MNVLDTCLQCLYSGLLPEPSSRTQLAKGLFLRNAFIRMQFVAGSWVVSRGWVTLLKGENKLNGRVILLPGLCCGLPDSYQCNWTLDSRGHGSWITHKRQWAHAEEVGLQVMGSGCALFVGFLLVIHSNEVKCTEQAHQGWSNHFSWMKKANMDIAVTAEVGKQAACSIDGFFSYLFYSFFPVCIITLKRKVTFICVISLFLAVEIWDVRKMASFVTKTRDSNLNVKEAISERL